MAADSTDRRNTLLILLCNGMHMEGQARTWFTPKQRAELWECWKRVNVWRTSPEGRNKSSVYRILL